MLNRTTLNVEVSGRGNRQPLWVERERERERERRERRERERVRGREKKRETTCLYA